MTSRNPGNKEKLGILGGSFDPVHLGHLELARETRTRFQLDRILLVPAQISPHKTTRTITAENHRVRMLELALLRQPGLEVCTVELERGGISYTIDTLKILAERYPGAELHLIIGMDTYRGFRTWKDCRDILERCHLLVATRPGYSRTCDPAVTGPGPESEMGYHPERNGESEQIYRCRATGQQIIFYPIPAQDISSSEIRRNIRQGISVKKWLPPGVDKYIIDHRLYRKPPVPSLDEESLE